MIEYKQERGDAMNTAKGIQRDKDGLIPMESLPEFDMMNEATKQAYRNLAKSWVRFDNSTVWYIRLCRKVGLDWLTFSGYKLKLCRVRTHLKYAIHDALSAMDRLVGRFNKWILRWARKG